MAKESELVKSIIDWLGKYGIRNSCEARMGIGIPDIVINIGARNNMPIVTDYYILAILEYVSKHKRITSADLEACFFMQKNKTQAYLNDLTMQGFLLKNGDYFQMRRKTINLNIGTIFSIEAKMADWKGGILQAQRYLSFSDYSFLALPKNKIHLVHTAILESTGIGLIAVENENVEEVYPPRLSTICDKKQKYIATSTVLSKQQPPSKRKIDPIFSVKIDRS